MYDPCKITNKVKWQFQHGTAIFLFAFNKYMSAKQERGAPQTGQGYKRVDDSAEQRTLSSKKPCHKVELKKTNQSPVQTSDNG